MTRPRLLSFELAWAGAAFDAIFPEPPRGVLPHGIKRMDPARFFDELVAEIPLEQSLGLRLTLWLVALAPLFTIRRLGTIASIEEPERVRVLERLLASPIYAVRQLVLGFKAMGALLYARSGTVRAAMNAPVRGSVVRLRASKDDARAPEGRARGGAHDHAAE